VNFLTRNHLSSMQTRIQLGHHCLWDRTGPNRESRHSFRHLCKRSWLDPREDHLRHSRLDRRGTPDLQSQGDRGSDQQQWPHTQVPWEQHHWYGQRSRFPKTEKDHRSCTVDPSFLC